MLNTTIFGHIGYLCNHVDSIFDYITIRCDVILHTVLLIGFTENLVNNDYLSRLLTNHDYLMLIYKLVINVTNTISYQNLNNLGFTFISLTNLLFNLVMVQNFVTYLPYYNLRILKLYGFLHVGLMYITTVFFIESVISNVSLFHFPTAAAIFFVYPLVGKFAVELIKHKTNQLISLDISKENNPIRIQKIAQLMIRFITRDKSRLHSLKKELELDDVIMAGLLIRHKSECKEAQCFCKQKALIDQISAYDMDHNSN